tara:strand:+ start:249 stop:629 length:381 start_codon:yes stop_codon:yes gene_type:complete
MGKRILVILFLTSLAVCKESSILYNFNNEVENFGEKNSKVKDDWIAIDKVQHFSYSLLISLGCQYILVNKMNNTEESSLPISSAFSFSAGLLKELNDQEGKNGYFSLKDMVANFGGIIVAAIVINQ